jgi:hypothetical protein
MVGIVIARAQHTTKIRAKPLIVSKKTILIIAHLCSEMAVFVRKSTFRQTWSIRYSRNKACRSFLLKDSNYRPQRVSDGYTVNILLKLWVCKLSFLKRHPLIQKSKIMKQRALIVVIKEILLPMNQPRLIDWSNTGRRMLPNSRQSMESNCRPQFGSSSWISWKFERILSI